MDDARHGGADPHTGAPSALDEQIAWLAARQHGVVARRQLIAAGASRAAIAHRLGRKRLHGIHPAVYAVGHPRLLPYARYMAAVLACGPGTVLSHRHAAALLGLLTAGSDRVEVTTPRLSAGPRPGIVVHRTRLLAPDEMTIEHNIPCTNFARTLVDLAGCEPERRLRRAFEQSLVLRLFDLRAMNVALGRARGRAGTGTLRCLVAQAVDEPPFTRSELERAFLDLVRKANLPPPVVNGLVLTHEVDFQGPSAHLVVEADSRTFHGHALAFHNDRQRDLELELAGWHVLRITWRQVLDEPERVVRLLRSRLGPTGARAHRNDRTAASHRRS
jgi:very-short-patch-repair endonuclease